MRFVDSHLHLDEPSAKHVVSLALANKTIIVTCGTDKKTSEAGLKLSAANPNAVVAFVGVHPSEAVKERSPDWVEGSLDRATGIGEVGLDPKYSAIGAGSAQANVLRRQLEAAERASKPVQVHSRGAETECLEVLSEFGLKSVLMHWFEGGAAFPEVLKRGYYVSFGPALLYSKKLERLARGADQARVLVETDFPVAYAPLGGARGPSLIPSVVFKLSELWGFSFEKTRELTVKNAIRFFGFIGGSVNSKADSRQV